MSRSSKRNILLIIWLFSFILAGAQDSLTLTTAKKDSLALSRKYPLFSYNPNIQVDLDDVWRQLMKRNSSIRTENINRKTGKIYFTVVPVVGYTLQTGFAGVFSTNFAFYTGESNQDNLSNVLTSITYSQFQQVIFPIQANIWTPGNRYNIVTDWRYLQYPSFTYGLGGNTSADTGYSIDYSYLRFHQYILKSIGKDLYAGPGYDLDYFWNVREIDPPAGKATDFETYGLTKKVIASAVSLHLLYDSRRNPINPENGYYASVSYRPNFSFLGGDANWQSLLFDLRSYIRFPGKTHNVLALWSYDWFTTGSGNPPYLLLPSTGWDAYSNTARGYIQGRFRSKNMVYLEGEYRFGITPNGLLGGVVFANAQTFTEPATGHYQYLIPGYGGGIRIALNKFSRTNLAVDYGWGQNGSGGFFVNLGEVF